MHLRIFDHDKDEIIQGSLGLLIYMVCLLLVLWKPELGGNPLLLVGLMVACLLILSANVWTIDWKSPRLWLIITLCIAAPLLPLAVRMQSTGSFNQSNPFTGEYRVQQVLYPEDSTGWESIKVDLYTFFEDHYIQIAENGTDYQQLGICTYVPPTAGQNTNGSWQSVPEDDPDGLYRVTAEADSTVTFSYYEKEQLQYKWLLRQADTAAFSVATYGHNIHGSLTWYPPNATDPDPDFNHTDVVNSATMTLAVAGLKTENLTLYEEYHHADSVEYQKYTLAPKENGVFSMKITTRYDGASEYALYRIPFEGGEYRFTLTFG